MTINTNGLGAAGTRITRRLGPESEIWQPIWQSIVGIVVLDIILTCILISCMIAGWWSFSIFLSAVGFLVGMIVLVFGRPSGRLLRIILGNLWGIGAVVGLLVGHTWHDALSTGLHLIWSQLATVAQLPLWVYPLAALVLIVVWIKANWQVALFLAVSLVVFGVVLLSDDRAWLQAWHYLKWLWVPYSWPVIGFGLLLALSMAINVLFPSLEWTMQPVSLEELREVGLRGLIAPGLFGKSEEHEPGEAMERRVRVESRVENENGYTGEAYVYLPDSNSARDFYRALSKGRPFTLSEAQRWGVGRRTFEKKLWPAFEDRGWAVWVNEQHHDQGRELTPEGKRHVEALVLGDPRH
jgi:hypothetical protein